MHTLNKVRPKREHVLSDLIAGLTFAVVNIPVCVGLILFAHHIAGYLKRSPWATRVVDWAFAGVLGAFAVRLIVAETR